MTYLGASDEEEAQRIENSLHRKLSITKLDSVEEEDAVAVGGKKSIQSQYLEHLKSGN